MDVVQLSKTSTHHLRFAWGESAISRITTKWFQMVRAYIGRLAPNFEYDFRHINTVKKVTPYNPIKHSNVSSFLC